MTTAIEWTDATWNPVTGCSRVSPGCDHCYMFALYPRLRGMGVPGYEAAPDVVTLIPDRIAQPLAWRSPRMIFVNSMSDVFHPRVPFEFVDDMFGTMISARQHVFQVLTKRPGRAVAWWQHASETIGAWPEHVWIGTSVETQRYAPRVEVLARVPAPVRFVSAEPLLGPLDLQHWLDNGAIHWLIAGGESGSRARPLEIDWLRQLRDDSQRAGVPFFLKQLGGARDKRGGEAAVLDGRRWQQMPTGIAHDPAPVADPVPVQSMFWSLE